MNNLPQVFMYQGAQIRMITKDNEPWWVAKDVCDVLGFSNLSETIKRLDEDEVSSTEVIDSMGRNQQTNIVTESGLYALILGSRKPEAKPFKRWITHEVVPSIRKHGAYMTPDTIEKTLTNPDFIIQLATKLKEEQAEKERERQARLLAEAKIEADRHKVVFAESLQVSEDSILIGQLAKLLKQNGIDIGQNRLFQILRDEGYLMSRGERYNMPTQRSMDMKLMEIKLGSRLSLTQGSKVTQTTKVTGKGVMYFINKFKQKQVTA
jgi:anti-repressor protein